MTKDLILSKIHDNIDLAVVFETAKKKLAEEYPKQAPEILAMSLREYERWTSEVVPWPNEEE